MGKNMRKLIVFEGIDGCGKTTLAKSLCQRNGFTFTKEPTFSSEKADELNLGSKNDVEREVEFAIDRIVHRIELVFSKTSEIIICDRYIWSGLAYCLKYNPKAFDFVQALYKHSFFPKPDAYIFVDTPVSICHERKKDQPLEDLIDLREHYLKTQQYISSKIIQFSCVNGIDNDVEALEKLLFNSSDFVQKRN